MFTIVYLCLSKVTQSYLKLLNMQAVNAKRTEKKTIEAQLAGLPVNSDTALEVEAAKVQSVRTAIARLHKKTKMEFTTQNISSTQSKQGGIYVWRTA